MSKSKKEEKSVEEEVSKEDSKENLKDDVKKSSKSKKEINKVDTSEVNKNSSLRTLIELVEESGIRRKDIIVRLADKGYLGQFYEEEEKKRISYPIKPTISEEEFKKIIGE